MESIHESTRTLSLSSPLVGVPNSLPSLIDARQKVEMVGKMKIPYGQELFDKVIQTYYPLLDPLVNPPFRIKALVKSVDETCQFFARSYYWNPLRWIREHINARLTMIRIISRNTGEHYTMEEAEIERWIRGVFTSIKSSATDLFRVRPLPQRKLQDVVDASYQLVELMKLEACKQEIFHEYHSYLVYPCQRACLAPSAYLLNPTNVKIDKTNLLGCGATSDIYRCIVNGQKAVAKTFRIFNSVNKKDKRKFLKEALLLRLIPHPYILPSFGVVMSQKELQIISPWMQNGDIVKYTKRHPNVCKKELVEQVADGLHFLQQYNIVHGDLKGDNILISDNGKACIADLGASIFLEASRPSPVLYKVTPSQPFSAFCSPIVHGTSQNQSVLSNNIALSGMSTFSEAGTMRYMSPERLFPEKHGEESARATPPSDVFAFGMLVWEVYTGEVPFPEIRSQYFAAQKIISGQRPPKPASMSADLWILVQSCWKKWPHTRPTIHNIYNMLATMP